MIDEQHFLSSFISGIKSTATLDCVSWNRNSAALSPFLGVCHTSGLYGKVCLGPSSVLNRPHFWLRFASSQRFSYTEVAEGISWACPRWQGGKQGRTCTFRCPFFLRTSNSASSFYLTNSNRKPGLRLPEHPMV